MRPTSNRNRFNRRLNQRQKATYKTLHPVQKNRATSYRNLDLPVKAVLTDNGREFCGTERPPYELYLDLNGTEHRRTKVKTPKTNGFVERFNGTVLG